MEKIAILYLQIFQAQAISYMYISYENKLLSVMKTHVNKQKPWKNKDPIVAPHSEAD